MGNPLNDCQKKLKAFEEQQDRKTIQFLQLEAENKLLRKVIANLDTRLDMQLDFFDNAMRNAQTLSELKLWWDGFLKDASKIDTEAPEFDDEAEKLREQHGITWNQETIDEQRLLKNVEWLGGAYPTAQAKLIHEIKGLMNGKQIKNLPVIKPITSHLQND
jgi:hypothetical protein